MKKLSRFCIAALLLIATSTTMHAQELLTELPVGQEAYIASEPKVLATIDWLENTPIGQEPEKRKKLNGLLVDWLTTSPTVTMTLNATNILTFSKENPELMIIFMAGWARYALQHNYSEDKLQGTLAGFKSVIKVYKSGFLKKDKEVDKLVKKDEDVTLKAWAKEVVERVD